MNVFSAFEITRPLSVPPCIAADEIEFAMVDYVLDRWPTASVERVGLAIGIGKQEAMLAGIDQGKAVAAAVMRGAGL